MSWTAPRTYTTAEVLSASVFNTDVRDNLRETCPATATTAGDLVYADGANSMGSRLGIGANGSLLASDGSGPVWRTGAGDSLAAAYTTLVSHNTYHRLGNATYFAYPADVEVTVTTGTDAAVFIKGNLRSDTTGASTFLSYQVSGASTKAASNLYAIRYESSNANDQIQAGTFQYHSGLTAGSNKFTLMAQMTAGLSTLQNVAIFVLPL